MKILKTKKVLITGILFIVLTFFIIYFLTSKCGQKYEFRLEGFGHAQESSEVNLVFAGDVMLGRLVGHRHQEEGFVELLQNFDTAIFKNADVAWVNLEGPISDTVVVQDLSSDNLNFLFSRESISALHNLGVRVVGLANNHTFNSGSAGLQTTQDLLEKSGIHWHGLPTKTGEESIYRFSKKGIKVSLVAVHTLYAESSLGISELIRSEKENGFFVVVLPHWGEEYQTTHSLRQEEYVRDWASAGADVVIGMHPHVVQDSQIIEKDDGSKTLVLYSLGNFIFDQIFSEETQMGLLVKMSINLEKLVSIDLVPVESVNLKPQYAEAGKREAIINRVCKNIASHCVFAESDIKIQF